MSAVKELSQIMLDIPCRCGGYAKRQIGNVEHFVGSKKIVVKNVPHYYCETCQTACYSTDVNVSNLLKYAIKRDLNEIDYK